MTSDANSAHYAALRMTLAREIGESQWHDLENRSFRTRAGPNYPDGSAAHAYVLRLPLDAGGLIDAGHLHDAGERSVVRRFWPGEPDQTGVVIRKGRGWAFSYAPGDADDEALFHLENHPIAVGRYLTITEADGRQLPFKVVHCHD
jgi:hypothetical protein